MLVMQSQRFNPLIPLRPLQFGLLALNLPKLAAVLPALKSWSLCLMLGNRSL